MSKFEKFNFIEGRTLKDTNVYTFKDDKENYLIVSEKLGKFQKGNKTQYLLFTYTIGDEKINQYIDRKSQEFLDMKNIRPIVDNLNGLVVQCSGCGHIVAKDKIRNSNNSKCVYCDIYYCKKCRKAHPIIELDDNRLCEKCRKEE